MTTKPRDWDANTYDVVASPIHAFGAALLDGLGLQGGETVLDAGCGSGAVPQRLLERLPNGRVIGVDGSPAMIDGARELLRDDPPGDLRVARLLELAPARA